MSYPFGQRKSGAPLVVVEHGRSSCTAMGEGPFVYWGPTTNRADGLTFSATDIITMNLAAGWESPEDVDKIKAKNAELLELNREKDERIRELERENARLSSDEDRQLVDQFLRGLDMQSDAVAGLRKLVPA